MAKKGMTKAEIYDKLKEKGITNEYDYLKRISKKEGSLDPKTKKAIFEVMGEVAEKYFNLPGAIEAYDHIQDKDNLFRIGDLYLSKARKIKSEMRKRHYSQYSSKDRTDFGYAFGAFKENIDPALEIFVKYGNDKQINRVIGMLISVANDIPGYESRTTSALKRANEICKESRDNNSGFLIALARGYEKQATEYEGNEAAKRVDPSFYKRHLKNTFSAAIDCYERALSPQGKSLPKDSARAKKIKERLTKLYEKIGEKEEV